MKKCRPNHLHCLPCGRTRDPEVCLCGCEASDIFCPELGSPLGSRLHHLHFFHGQEAMDLHRLEEMDRQYHKDHPPKCDDYCWEDRILALDEIHLDRHCFEGVRLMREEFVDEVTSRVAGRVVAVVAPVPEMPLQSDN
jgi:hypothetical protein